MTATGKTYGDALYDLAAEEALCDELLEQVKLLARLFRENPQYPALLASPDIPREERLRRVLERDGITREAAEARMSNQHEDEYYTRRSHFVITNSSDLAHLEKEVERCRRFLCL